MEEMITVPRNLLEKMMVLANWALIGHEKNDPDEPWASDLKAYEKMLAILKAIKK